MSKSKKQPQPTTTTPKAKMKVLYQNLNGVWYAFADGGDDVFFGRVTLESKAGEAKPTATPTRTKKRKTAEAA